MRLACLLLVSTAYAGTNDLEYGPTTRALRSPSADAVTDAGLVGGTLGYGHFVAEPMPRLSLWAEAGFGWGSAHGEMFQEMSTDISNIALTVGARAQYRLHERIAFDARLDVGRAWTSLTLEQGDTKVSDSGWGNLAVGTLGIELLAIATPRFSLGLRLELGYAKTSAVALAPHADNTDDTLKLMTTSASIGHLDLGGPLAGFAVVSRF